MSSNDRANIEGGGREALHVPIECKVRRVDCSWRASDIAAEMVLAQIT
jgi:hypothetical protein